MFQNNRVWITGVFLLQLCPAVAREINIEPCVNGGLVEVAAGHKTSLTCTADGDIQWRIHWHPNQSHMFADCTHSSCTMLISAPFSEIFEATVTEAHSKRITINAENNTKIHENIHLVNDSLQCIRIVLNKTYSNGSANCTLNYVYPPQKVSCEGVATSPSVNVSCTIGSVYSSRRVYKCHLLLARNNKTESLETVTMTTSPTSVKITESEVKVSGSCYFNTRLLPEEDNNSLFVSVSPGGLSYPVIFRTSDTIIPDDPPENVTCEGVESSLSVNVSCTIGSVYSSRRVYKCHLLLATNNKTESLETVTMTTSPTSVKIAESEVKVSGSCYFNTRLLPEEDNTILFVTVSPGGRSYPVIFRTNDTIIPDVDNHTGLRTNMEVVTGVVTGVVFVIAVVIIIVVAIKRGKNEKGLSKGTA